MAIAAGVIVAWPSTAASIPANWTRVTALDDKYPRGVPTAATNPGSTGGSNTHSAHQVPSHNHGGSVSHTHPSGNTGNNVGAVTNTASSTGKTFVTTHTHTVTPPAATMSINSATHNFGVNSAEPLHRTVIWIQSNGSPTEFPSGVVALWAASGTPPTNWSIDTNFQDRYARGAAGGANGGANGGAATHTHNVAASQVHNQSGSHVHTFPTIDASGGSATSGATDLVAQQGHIHGGVVDYSLSTADTDATSGTSTADAADPPYYKLHYIQSASGAGVPAQIIALWTGTIASIPAGWIICNGSNGTPNLLDQFIKGANGDGQRGSTGGSTTHGHGTFTHTHLAGHGGAHTHPTLSSPDISNTVSATGSTTSMANGSHTHTVPTLTASTTAFTNDSGATVTTDSSLPAYYTVAFIQNTTADVADSENLAVNVTESESLTTTDDKADSDNAAVNITEAEQLDVGLEDTDNAAVNITEAESVESQDAKADADNNAVNVTEAETLDVAQADSENLAVNITEAEQLDAAAADADNNAVNVTEAESIIATVDLADADTLAVNVTETESLEFQASPQLRRVIAEAYTSTGQKLAFGPIPVLKFDYSLGLDKIGDFVTHMPANDDKTTYLLQGYELRFYREGEGLVFRGLIDGLEWQVSSTGQKILEVTGQSIARQLVWKNTLLGMQFANTSVPSAATTLLANTGWTQGTVDTPAGFGFTSRMDGISRWEGLAALAKTAGLHLREDNVNKQVDITAAGVLRTIVMQNVGQARPDLAVYPISEAALFEESTDLWNYVVPIGQGEGINALNLRMANRPTQLCLNPSFETNTTGWTPTNSTVTRTATAAMHGSFVGRVARTSGTEYSVAYSSALGGPTAGRTFAARVYVGVAGSEVGKAIKVRLRGTGGAAGTEQTEITQTLGNGFNYIELEHTLAANDRTAIQLVIEQTTAVAAESFDVDAVILAEKPLATAPYHILTATGPDSQTFYYLADETSIIENGQREKILAAKEIVPLSPVSAEVRAAANALYDNAVTALRRMKDTAKTYRAFPLGLQHYSAGLPLLEVGDRVRFIYRDGTKMADELVYIMGFTRSFDASGADHWDMMLSTVDRDPDADARQEVEDYSSAYTLKTAVRPYTFVDTFSERQSIDSTHDVDLVIDLWDNVQYLHKAVLSVALEPVRSNATGVADGGGSTSGSGGGSTSGSGSSHSHTFSGGTVSSGGGTTSSSNGSHRHIVFGATDPQITADLITLGTNESTSHGHTENLAGSYTQNATTASNSVPHTHTVDDFELWVYYLGAEPGGIGLEIVELGVHGNRLEAYDNLYTLENVSSHTHTTPDHSHGFSGGTNSSESSHTHTVSSHTHTVPDHTHALQFGIYEGSGPSNPNVRVIINGVDRTVALGGPFDNDFFEKDITQYLLDSDGQPLAGRQTVTFESDELLDLEAIVKTLQTATSVVPI